MFSMTGFGIAEKINPEYKIKIQIKSVNHRYLDLKVKGVSNDFELENKIKEYVSKRLNRGHIDLLVEIEKYLEDDIELNEDLFKLYSKVVTQAKRELGDTTQVRPEWILNQPRVLERKTREEEDHLSKLVMETLVLACDSLNSMRRAEGENLSNDMKIKLAQLNLIHAQVKKASIISNEELASQLKQRIGEIQKEFSLDQGRIATEVALLLDKISIDEEITRLSSHIEQFNVIMDAREPVGRKLDFLLQEMNREANTMGSKSRNTQVLHDVVEIKAIIENLREQVQNIE